MNANIYVDKISVIVPVYNNEKYIERCLRSIMENTYSNLEIICINDGSTDDSLSIIKSIAKTDDRIKVVSTENRGVSAARNLGMSMATGEYIAFIDSDDWIHIKYFETLLYLAKTTNSDIAIGNMERTYLWDDAKRKSVINFNFKMLSESDFYNHHSAKHYVWGRLYKSKILFGQHFDDEIKFAEDKCFNASIMFANKRVNISYTDAVLYFYFLRQDSVVQTFSPDMLMPVAKWYGEKIENLQDMNNYLFVREALSTMMSCRYLYEYGSPDKWITVKKEIKEMLHKALKIFCSMKNVSVTVKFAFIMMVCFSKIYRMFRIYNDRSLLAWEKNTKSKRADV